GDRAVDLDRRHPPGTRGDADPPGAGAVACVAGARRLRRAERATVTVRRGLLAVLTALALGACAQPAARIEAPVAAAPAMPPPAPAAEAPRQADQLARIASELSELQNAAAKL